MSVPAVSKMSFQYKLVLDSILEFLVELVSMELNHLAAILHVYAGDLNFVN